MTERHRLSVACLLVFAVCNAARADAPRALFITLGTGGGPVVQAAQAQPSNAVVVGDAVYVFDAGDGVMRQLARAGLPLRNIRAVFITHFHVDHVAGLGPLLIDRFVTGNTAALPVYGPPGTVEMLGDLAVAYRPIINASHVGGPTFDHSFAAHDLSARVESPQVVYEDSNLRVLAISVEHFRPSPGLPDYPTSPSAYGFRIETARRSFVFTGDTGATGALTTLAKDADVLVTEVVDLEAIAAVLKRNPALGESGARATVEGMRLNHLSPADIGRIAAEANVRSVVITHQVPGPADVPGTEGYVSGVVRVFRGRVTVARDLDRF